MLTLVDWHAFRIGNQAYFNQRESGLYQAEVAGFFSAALVALQLVVEVGSSLIIWRLVFFLLGKTAIRLVELCRMVDMRLPIIPGLIPLRICPGRYSQLSLSCSCGCRPSRHLLPIRPCSGFLQPSLRNLRHEATISQKSRPQEYETDSSMPKTLSRLHYERLLWASRTRTTLSSPRKLLNGDTCIWPLICLQLVLLLHNCRTSRSWISSG